jgi:RHS repeat-associated protein
MESDPEHNSGAYDFGARIMDARLGRWMSIDAYFFKYPEMGPYNFVRNCPLKYIDPDGNDIIDIIIKKATWGNNGSDRTLHVQASAKLKIAIYNNSTSNIGMDQLKADIEEKMETALSGQTAYFKVSDNKDYTKGTYLPKTTDFNLIVDIKIDVEVEVVTSLSQVADNQTVVILTDHIIKSYGKANINDPLGLYFGNGTALVETNKQTYQGVLRTSIHEVGHDLGMSDGYTEKNGEIVNPGSGYMGAINAQGNYFTAQALGEFHKSVMETVWTSVRLDKDKKLTKHNKIYTNVKKRSEVAKETIKSGRKK